MSSTPSASLRIAIADDSLLVREGTARVVENFDMEVTGQAGDVDELMQVVRESTPDLVVLDIRMPPSFTDEGLQAAAAIRLECGEDIGILVLSHHIEPEFAMRLIREGSRSTGYLLKDRLADLQDFVDAVRRVARGGTVVDPAVIRELVGRPTSQDRLAGLSEREFDVLTLMAEGRSNQAIADRLFVTLKTVEAHIASIFSKLDLPPEPDDHRRVLAVLAFLTTRSSPPARLDASL